MARTTSQTTTDHETIRRWVEERGGWPAEVTSTARGAPGTGIIRIDFPGYSGEGKLDRIEWDDWFRKFDESGLAFVYQDTTAGGEQSNFNKLVAKETARARAAGRRTPRASAGAARKGRSAGAARRGRTAAGGRGRPASRTTKRRGAAGATKSAARGGRSAAAARGTGRKAGKTTGRRAAAGAASARTAGGRGKARAGGRVAGGRSRGAAGRKAGGRTSRRSSR